MMLKIIYKNNLIFKSEIHLITNFIRIMKTICVKKLQVIINLKINKINIHNRRDRIFNKIRKIKKYLINIQ